jgi:hypothetical protein
MQAGIGAHGDTKPEDSHAEVVQCLKVAAIAETRRRGDGIVDMRRFSVNAVSRLDEW